ncbi:MAG: hypothetical protein ACOYMF_06160 [Bacteroidales bacterium]
MKTLKLLFAFTLISFSSLGQQAGVFIGISKDAGKTYGVNFSNLKDGKGVYMALYRYSFVPYQHKIAERINDGRLADSIISNNYNGISLGMTIMLTDENAKYPVSLLAGAGNVDRIEIHQQYNPITCEVSYYVKLKKIFSPEIGLNVAAYNSKIMQAGIQLTYKSFVGMAASFFFSINL